MFSIRLREHPLIAILCLAAALLLAPPARAAQKDPVRLDQAIVAVLDRGALGLEVALEPGLCERLAREEFVRLADIPLPGGRAVDLRLERFAWPPASGLVGRNGSLAPGQTLTGGLDLTFWSGFVSGEPESEVFLAFSRRGTRGWLRCGGELVHLLAGPGEAGGWASPAHFLLRDGDLRKLGATPPAGCSTPPPAVPRPAGFGPSRSPSSAAGGRTGTLPLIQARLALETDFQFYSLFNDLDAARAYALALLGAASLRYEEQAGIVLVPVYLGLHDNANDPWAAPDTPGASAGTLLDEFRQAWDQGAAPVAADVHHFVSGAIFGGGVAYLGTVCNRDWSFGVSTGIGGTTPFPLVPGGWANWDFFVVAHEIGHNFNAIHTHGYCPPLDECAPPGSFGPCQTQQVCTSSGTVMSYCHVCAGGMTNITTYFHPQSAADMRSFAEGSCLPRLAGQTLRVGVEAGGAQWSNGFGGPALSADGRFTAFRSQAADLVPQDTNNAWDAFLHDALAGTTVRASVSSAGVEGNGNSFSFSLAADGRRVAFYSYATNLVPGDTNNAVDVFLRDTATATTLRASVSSAGVEGNGNSWYPAVSADGRFVAFESAAANLVPGDTNGHTDIFLHDTQSGTTLLVSVAQGGAPADNSSYSAAVSADGRFVAFWSYASSLVPGDVNGYGDVFVRDTQLGTTALASVSSAGALGNDVSGWIFPGASLSLAADGRCVAFLSRATNLVPGDTNGTFDIFLRDTQLGTTVRASVDSAGVQGNGSSYFPSVSADGRCVAFESWATNLAPGDGNGWKDVFVRDLVAGTTQRASVDSSGAQAQGGHSGSPCLSADGRFVAFYSSAPSLVPGDGNGAEDAFLHERLLHPAAGSWTQLGGGTAGALGKPALSAWGALQYGSTVYIGLANAPQSAVCLLITSNDWQALPFSQGMLWPVFSVVVPVKASVAGQLVVAANWPAGIPAQTSCYVQWAVADPSALSGVGFTLSNAAWGLSN
ncbi:MAG: PD40 domain-containing protein [Planctomycetes bacterium]|nr:PD40 domain-containing protein [Planctomycetota bacterium]